MDLADVVSVQKFQELSAQQKDELHETLLDLAQVTDEISKKSLRRTLDIALAVLRYKGQQVQKLQQEAGSSDDSLKEQILDENKKLKCRLDALEQEKQSYEDKVKSLTDEIFVLQQRLEQAATTGDISDKESSDPLSELDKQEELLRNIDEKNRHIKRLLREIEALQTQNIDQSKVIIELEKQVQEAKAKALKLSADLALVDGERKALKESINELQVEISRLEGNVTYLEEERERGERELKDIIRKLGTKTQSYKKLLSQKDSELKKLSTRTGPSNSSILKSSDTESTDMKTGETQLEEDTERDTKKLLHAIESRDKLIEQLELKIKTMAEEMLSSTQLMDKISHERLEEQSINKPRPCCRLAEEALHAANVRCRELAELLERCEEDNVLKSKQALRAISALDAYQKGEDGLVRALKKCSSLERKLVSRDKQIQGLVTELNSMQEVVHENKILRKRLNLPDDAIIVAKNAITKERSKDKIIERLKLKLRASEEMRLQLKIQKTDLRTELLALQKKSPDTREDNADSVRFPSEVGEVEDTLELNSGGDARCQKIISNPVCDRNLHDELEYKHEEIVAENDALRQGMMDILEKLREYNDSSEHITLDTEILLRLLQALRKHPESSTTATNLHLENELQSLKLREKSLQELLKQEVVETDDLSSIESAREDGEVRLNNSDLVLEIPKAIDSSTRPTTPSKILDQSLFPVINLEDTPTMEPKAMEPMEADEMRALRLQLSELQVYRRRYEELQQIVENSGPGVGNIDTTCLERITQLELECSKKDRCYNYLREDFDMALTECKLKEIKHIAECADLKREIKEQSEKIKELQEVSTKREASAQYSVDEYLALQRTNTDLQARVGYMLQHVVNGRISAEIKGDGVCTEYGIIRENLQLDYLTVEEYEQLKEKVEISEKEKSKLMRKCAQLESLLEIAQEQIQSQQKLLNDLTDSHINLRHLVADLQSTGEDKLVLAKVQRDLNSAQYEVNNLKSELEQLQQKCASLELRNQINDQETAQLNERFQVEHGLKDTKIKFLKKSLFLLKEKYCKFTPLIFLADFICTYTKFSQRFAQVEASFQLKLSESIKEDVERVLSTKIEEYVELRDESQRLVKLVKAETQNKLLEVQLVELKQSYCDLQQELSKERIARAAEEEHWRTVEALFAINGGDSPYHKPKSHDVATSTELHIEPIMVDIGMNTDTPVAAERRLSIPLQSSLTEKVERASSNISPAKQKPEQGKMEKDYESVAEGVAEEIMTVEGEKTQFESKSKDKKGRKEGNKEEVNTKEVGKERGKDAERENEKDGGDFKQDEANMLKKIDVIIQTSLKTPVKSLGVQTSLLDHDYHKSDERLSKEMLQETLSLAEERYKSLKQTEEKLSKASLEIEELKKQISEAKASEEPTDDPHQHADIIEKTILSFHALLSEKDKSITAYQDLLESEREQTQLSALKLNQDIETLKNTLQSLSNDIKCKDTEIQELRERLESVQEQSQEANVDSARGDRSEASGDNSLNEISDEKIEEMFAHDTESVTAVQEPLTATKELDTIEEKQDTEMLKEIPTLLSEIKQLTERSNYWEDMLKIKNEEILLLKEKLKHQEEEKAMELAINSEAEHLKLMLEEKDKHIHELVATLNSFHEDQQRYLKDSKNFSADQISKLAADLTRSETTNKIYYAQIEALRRQVSNLTQREKQSRELNQSLRNELVKRPVVSIKSELNARAKSENLNKRIQQLEFDLEDARVQIRRQNAIIEARKAKTHSEVSLWEKQKRWQQSAEKYKAKLDETESTLERTKSLLNTARNAIARLEKEKHMLETRFGRGMHGPTSHNPKCCNMSSCPNLHPSMAARYTPSETPDTYTGVSSNSSSPTHTASAKCLPQRQHYSVDGEHCNQSQLIEALKARCEMQQRKIAAMELEGKGSNALTTELEKLQERFSACEAQNIRLEARNLQLQLDNDLLRQGDSSERLQKRIKHLEDYIIALKEEMAQSEARRQLCKCSGIKLNTHTGQSAEQTILSLRNIIEKLRVENKYLKDGRHSAESRSPSRTPTEFSRLEKTHSMSLKKVGQAELSAKTKCEVCSNCRKEYINNTDELNFVREQLAKKTQLLQKAKVLLTRAAAKEKVLKEQLSLWKRKCSELQNFPVIDEISE